MKSNNMTLMSTIERYLTRTIASIFLMLTIWQGIGLGIDLAIAAPATSNIVEQVANKAERQKDRVQSAMKDSNQSAKQNMDKAKNAIDKNAKKIEKSAKDTTKKAKNFFGF